MTSNFDHGMVERNLFGEVIEPEVDPLEPLLREHDQQSFASRLSRIKYVEKIHPDGWFLTSLELHYLMLEAKATYINGQFAATILLTQSVIEQWLHSQLQGKYSLSPRAGLHEITTCIQENNLLHPFLIKKVDQLRRIRNPFVHVRPPDDPDLLSRRAFSVFEMPEDLIENDAREALTTMYAIIINFS